MDVNYHATTNMKNTNTDHVHNIGAVQPFPYVEIQTGQNVLSLPQLQSDEYNSQFEVFMDIRVHDIYFTCIWYMQCIRQ